MKISRRHTCLPDQAMGFTIIEVLIVLAIGGLILLLVFQAIPALTRSSRNNQRKQDVTAILQAVSHYELNNSADFPSATNVSKNLLLQYVQFSYYTTGSVSITPLTSGTTVITEPSTPPSIDEVQIYDYQKCLSDNSGTSDSQGADYSSIVALYAIESGSGAVLKCQQL